MVIPVTDKAVMEQKFVLYLSRIHALMEYLRAQYIQRAVDNVTVPVSNNSRRNEIPTYGNRPDLITKETKRVAYS